LILVETAGFDAVSLHLSFHLPPPFVLLVAAVEGTELAVLVAVLYMPPPVVHEIRLLTAEGDFLERHYAVGIEAE
jgi:hypothetical protein